MPPITFTPGKGRLALDRYDFQHHVEGTDFRHQAAETDLIPNIVIDGYNADNVQSALTQVGSSIATLELSGKGFITIGDGYDTYHNSLATPSTPYDSAIPAFDGYLNDLLNNPANPLYFRIRDGGVVLIKAGTYKFTGTVNVPAGIILMGEGYGTKIVNQLASPAPLFAIQPDTTRIPDNGEDANETFIYNRETIFVNLTIADNFLVPKFLGDLSYKTPQNTDSIHPLISLLEGASLSCDNVKLVGKTTYVSNVLSALTSLAIATDSTIPSSTGTRLKVINSSIDGFSVPIKFTASGAQDDQLVVSNNIIRAYGFLNGDLVLNHNNTFMQVNTCNAIISNNYCYAATTNYISNTSDLTSLAFLYPVGSVPAAQGKPRITISSNNINVARPDTTDPNTTFKFVILNAPIGGIFSLLVFGNHFKNGKDFSIASDSTTAQFTLTDTSATISPSSTITLSSPTTNITSTAVNLGAGSTLTIGSSSMTSSVLTAAGTIVMGSSTISVDGFGQTKTTDGSGNVQIAGQVSKMLTSDVLSFITVAADTNLSFAAAVNDVWTLEFNGTVTCDANSGGNFAINAPTGATITGWAIGESTSGTYLAKQITSTALVGPFITQASATEPLRIFARVKLDGTHAGNITIQFASALFDADIVIKAGSYLIARRATAV